MAALCAWGMGACVRARSGSPAWTSLAPPRLVQLHADFALAAVPALAANAGARPQGVLTYTLPDGTKRSVRMAPSGGGPEEVVDEQDGTAWSALDVDRDGRVDELSRRRGASALRVEDKNRDGHFERVLFEDPGPDGRVHLTEFLDEDGDGAFELARAVPEPDAGTAPLVADAGAGDAGAPDAGVQR